MIKKVKKVMIGYLQRMLKRFYWKISSVFTKKDGELKLNLEFKMKQELNANLKK